jgi:hypothetical protein
MLIEVQSIAFGMSRCSTRRHLGGATWTERRAAEAVKGRDAAASADYLIDPHARGRADGRGGISADICRMPLRQFGCGFGGCCPCPWTPPLLLLHHRCKPQVKCRMWSN